MGRARLQKEKRVRGFTLAETVVAMAVILLISASAISAIAYASSLSKHNDNRLFFAMEIDNYVECYIDDGFSTEVGSLLSFHLGGTASNFAQARQELPGYRFYYGGNYEILPLTDVGSAAFFIDVTLVVGGGFWAEASTSSGKKLYQLQGIFLRAADYEVLGGGV